MLACCLPARPITHAGCDELFIACACRLHALPPSHILASAITCPSRLLADCNELFIACAKCKQELNGCCCQECMQAPRLLRPAKFGGGNYGACMCGGAKGVCLHGLSPAAPASCQVWRRQLWCVHVWWLQGRLLAWFEPRGSCVLPSLAEATMVRACVVAPRAFACMV
eukprot:1158975-Pelagomonas_calceolata.AAC.33